MDPSATKGGAMGKSILLIIYRVLISLFVVLYMVVPFKSDDFSLKAYECHTIDCREDEIFSYIS